MKDETFLTIGEVSRIVGVSDARIRAYEAQGVIAPQRVGNSNHPIRLFTSRDVDAIKKHRAKIRR
mgnify:CR=1 FL=1